MKTSVVISTLLSVLAIPLASAQFLETFDNLDGWNTYTSGGGALTPTVEDGNLKLATENFTTETAVTRTVRVVTKLAYEDLNFFESGAPVSFVVNNLSIVSAGATTSFLIGLEPTGANANIYGRTNSIYFSQNGTANASLVIRDNGTITTLATFTSDQLSLNYSSISFYLTDSTWAFALHGITGNELASVSGSLTAPVNTGWASDLYAHITLNQSSTTGGVSGTSHSTLLIGGINVIPEPAVMAAIFGLAAIGLVLFRNYGRK